MKYKIFDLSSYMYGKPVNLIRINNNNSEVFTPSLQWRYVIQLYALASQYKYSQSLKLYV